MTYERPRILRCEPVLGLLAVDTLVSDPDTVRSDRDAKENIVSVRWADGPKVESSEAVVGLLATDFSAVSDRDNSDGGVQE